MQKWQIPGASLAVMQGNKMIVSCGYGWANLEERLPMHPNSLFRLGSISKTITAIGILKLIEQNKLSLDDKAFSLLSDLIPLNKSKTNSEIYKITIRASARDLVNILQALYDDKILNERKIPQILSE